MIEDFQELLFALCAEPGTPGDESEAADARRGSFRIAAKPKSIEWETSYAVWETAALNGRYFWMLI